MPLKLRAKFDECRHEARYYTNFHAECCRDPRSLTQHSINIIDPRSALYYTTPKRSIMKKPMPCKVDSGPSPKPIKRGTCYTSSIHSFLVSVSVRLAFAISFVVGDVLTQSLQARFVPPPLRAHLLEEDKKIFLLLLRLRVFGVQCLQIRSQRSDLRAQLLSLLLMRYASSEMFTIEDQDKIFTSLLAWLWASLALARSSSISLALSPNFGPKGGYNHGLLSGFIYAPGHTSEIQIVLNISSFRPTR